MRSKRSCFSSAFFLKNCFRFWPVWTAYLIVMIFIMPVQICTGPDFDKLSALSSALVSGLNPLFPAVFSIISAAAVFSYLFFPKSCYCIHAMPLKRQQLFFTNWLSGLTFLVIPQIITFICSLIICIVKDISHVEYLLSWLLITIGIIFFFYNLGVFCCMLTGHIGGVFGFFVAILALSPVIHFIIVGQMSILCFGYTDISSSVAPGYIPAYRFEFLSPYTFIWNLVYVKTNLSSSGTVTDMHIVGGKYIPFYCIAAIIILILAAVMYQRRKMETSGDILAFSWLSPVFRWITGITGGMVTALILRSFINPPIYSAQFFHIILCTLFTWIWFHIAEMILQKRFRIFSCRRFIQWALCAGTCFVLLCCVRMDIFHIEEYIPQENSVYSVSFKAPDEYISHSRTVIREIQDLHSTIIKNKNIYEPYAEQYYKDLQNDGSLSSDLTSVSITYFLKDGGQVIRNYIIPADEESLKDPESASSKADKILSDPDLYLQNIIAENYRDLTVTGGNLSTYVPSESRSVSEQFQDLTKEQAQAIYSAFCQDLKDHNTGASIRPDSKDQYYNTLSIIFSCPDGIHTPYAQTANAVQNRLSAQNYTITAQDTTTEATLTINPNCRHTIEMLKQLGLIDSQNLLLTVDEYTEYSES